jgi:hypothetical protein
MGTPPLPSGALRVSFATLIGATSDSTFAQVPAAVKIAVTTDQGLVVDDVETGDFPSSTPTSSVRHPRRTIPHSVTRYRRQRPLVVSGMTRQLATDACAPGVPLTIR